MDEIQMEMLKQVADIHGVPQGAYNFRVNGQGAGRNTTEHIDIVTKEDKQGIDIIVKPGTKNESVHIPVVLSQSGLKEMVYNDFYIGAGADVTIVAGCGIHNSGCNDSRHDGIHTFHIGPNANVRYEEKHYGEGEGTGAKILNPVTKIIMEKDSVFTLDTAQIKGVDSTKRQTEVVMGEGAKLFVVEKLMTHGSQSAVSDMDIYLNGTGGSARITSRSVARGQSKQVFHPRAVGNALCHAHIQCDSIIMDKAQVCSIPEIDAKHVDAAIIHEAAIGRINSEQLIKLNTFGLDNEAAEAVIIENFLN